MPLPNTEVSLLLNGDSSSTQNVLNPEQSSRFKFTENLVYNEFYILTADRENMNKGVICEDLQLGSITGDLSGIQFKCYKEQYYVSGTIRGLLEKDKLALLVDNKEMTFKNGQHVFLSQEDYDVTYTIGLDPSKNENYTCNLNGAITGRLDSSVTNIDIDCSPKKFSASGSISGAPPDAKISVTISSTETSKSETVDLSRGNSNFNIQDALSYKSQYLVSAKPEDNSSKVTCLSFQGDKEVTGDVTNIKVQCESSDFSVTGGVSGLLSSDKVPLTGASEGHYGIGPHVFIANKAPGTQYNIQVDKAHNTIYECEIEGHNNGTLSSDINDVSILCEPKKFSLSGNINGAPTTGTLNIKVDSASHQATQDLDLSLKPTKYSLSQALTYGAYYTVEASVSGEPLVLCEILKKDEKVEDDVKDAHINCQIKSLNAKGTVSGLLGNDKVDLSGTDSPDGHFENGFHTFISSQGSKTTRYSISITSDANANYDCIIDVDYKGELQSDVDNIVITCKPKTFSISGTISIALTKGLLLLKISDGRQTPKEIQIDLSKSDRSYLEENSLTYASYYSVFASVKDNPFVSCSPLSLDKPVDENVEGVNIECLVSSYNVTGGVYGLIDKDTVSLTGADLTEYGNGNHVFKIGSYEETFDIGINSSGNSYYACQVNNQDTVHITVQNPFLNIECTPNKYDISGKITGLPKSKSITIRISFGSGKSEFAENTSLKGDLSYSKTGLIP